jgi:hypothetical protein
LTEEEYKGYIADIFLLHARERFGQMLGYLCEKSLLSQREIGRRATKYRAYLKKNGYLPSEGSTKAVDYTGISKVIYAKVIPSYAQVFIWFHVLKEQFKSEEYAKACEKVHEPVFVLTDEFETDMWHLALFGTPKEVVEAFKRHEFAVYGS